MDRQYQHVDQMESDQILVTTYSGQRDRPYITLRGWTEAKAGGNPVKVLGELSINPVFVSPGTPVPPAGHPNQGVAQV